MNNIKKVIRTTLKHELISGSFYVFLGGLVASFIAFGFNLLMVRTLSYSDYGAYASLISLITLAAIPSQSLTSTIVRFATNFFTNDEIGKASLFYKKISFFWILVGAFMLVGVWGFSNVISSFLHIQNTLFILIAALSIALSYTSIVNISFLQSLLKFKYMAFSYISGSVIKIILGGLIIYFSFGVGGALWAVFLMIFVIYILGFFPLRFLFNVKEKEVDINWREIFIYAFPTAVTVLSFTSLITTDVILVKHFFTPYEAGLYGGISLIGKVIFFFTAPIASVMFPLMVKRQTKGEDHRGIFNLALILVTVPSVLITLSYFIFPEFIVRIFLGGREYIKIVPFLGIFGIYITIYSILNVVVNMFLSLKKTKIAAVALIVSFLQIILISKFNDNFYQTIYISIFCSTLLLGSLLLYYIKRHGFYKLQK